jgi:surfeit locus 1 family protein
MKLAFGNRTLAPNPWLTIAAVAAFVLFVSLGRWQWARGELRSQQWADFEAGARQAVPLGMRSLEDVPRYQRVSVTGRYDPERQVLLENRTHAGRPGYDVLTPLEREDGRLLLVNRGWVPFLGYRDRPPDISFEPESPITVTGRVDNLPVPGIGTGRITEPPGRSWPKLASFPDAEQLAAVLGRSQLDARLLMLDRDQPHGYVREWQPAGTRPATHWSYAVQWWSFAALVVILWLVLSLRKKEGPPTS